MPRVTIPDHEYDDLFRSIFNGLGVHRTIAPDHYQIIDRIGGDNIFVSFAPEATIPGQPIPFRLEWRRQTGGEVALKQIEATHATRIEAAVGQPLEWDYKPGRKAALLNLWYTGPDSDAARIAWVLETAPRFIQALRDAS